MNDKKKSSRSLSQSSVCNSQSSTFVRSFKLCVQCAVAVLIMFWWTEGPFIKCVLDLIGINVIIRIRLESGLKCEVSYRGCTHADWCHHPIVVNLSSQVSASWLDDKNDDVFCGQCWGNFMNEIAVMHRYFKCIKYYLLSMRSFASVI